MARVDMATCYSELAQFTSRFIRSIQHMGSKEGSMDVHHHLTSSSSSTPFIHIPAADGHQFRESDLSKIRVKRALWISWTSNPNLPVIPSNMEEPCSSSPPSSLDLRVPELCPSRLIQADQLRLGCGAGLALGFTRLAALGTGGPGRGRAERGHGRVERHCEEVPLRRVRGTGWTVPGTGEDQKMTNSRFDIWEVLFFFTWEV